MKKVLYIWMYLMFFATASVAQTSDKLETVYTNKAMKAFVVKDFAGAAQYLNQVLQINPTNAQAVKLIAHCYYSLAEQYYATGEMQMAEEQLSMLYQYDPENAKGKGLEAKIQRKQNVSVAQTHQPMPQQNFVPPQASNTPQQIIIQSPEQKGPTDSEMLLKSFMVSVERSNKMMDENHVTQRYSDSLRAVEQARLVEVMKQTVDVGATSSQQTVLMVAGLGVALILTIVLIIMIVLRSGLKSSQQMQERHNEVMQHLLLTSQANANQMVNPQLLLAGPNAGVKPIEAIPSAENKLESQDDKERADAVEKVAAEIAALPTAPASIAKLEKLKLLLEDPSNRVRANTALVLYKYYPEIAMNTLGNMVSSGSKRMAASAIWSLGEINTREVWMILKDPSIDKTDEIIQHNLLTSLKKMQQRGGVSYSDEEKLELVELIEMLEK